MKKQYLFVLLLIVSILGNAIMLNFSVLEIGEYSYKSVGVVNSLYYRIENAEIIKSVKFRSGNVLIEKKIDGNIDSNEFGIYIVNGDTVVTKQTNNYGVERNYKIHNIFSIEDSEGNIYKNNAAIFIQITFAIIDIMLVIFTIYYSKKMTTK